MKVFVAGGTGAIGRHAVRALVRAGHEVTALARSPEKAAMLQREGAVPITVSIFDRAGLAQACKGHEAVVNLATAIPSTSKFMDSTAWAANDRIRTEGSAAIVDAAGAAGAARVVQESVSMLYRDRGDAWIDDDWPTDDYPMARANHAAEASAHRFSAAGGIGVVLRFGWFYGPGATHSEVFLALARRHICVMMGRPDGYVSSIHVADGGAAVVAALGLPREHTTSSTTNRSRSAPMLTHWPPPRGSGHGSAFPVGSRACLVTDRHRSRARCASATGDSGTRPDGHPRIRPLAKASRRWLRLQPRTEREADEHARAAQPALPADGAARRR